MGIDTFFEFGKSLTSAEFMNVLTLYIRKRLTDNRS